MLARAGAGSTLHTKPDTPDMQCSTALHIRNMLLLGSKAVHFVQTQHSAVCSVHRQLSPSVGKDLHPCIACRSCYCYYPHNKLESEFCQLYKATKICLFGNQSPLHFSASTQSPYLALNCLPYGFLPLLPPPFQLQKCLLRSGCPPGCRNGESGSKFELC